MNHPKYFLVAAALFGATVLTAGPLFAQPAHTIYGRVADAADGEALVGVHIAVWDSAGVSLLTGAVTDLDGRFSLDLHPPGDLFLRISSIGYHPYERLLSFDDSLQKNLGQVMLVPASIEHDEVVVEGERMRASRRGGSTVYHVSDQMAEAIPSAVEMLRMVPGVQVDLMRSVSIEGSDRIVVMVNERERDPSYLSQLGSGDIAAIEIVQPPPAGHPADVTAVMNVRLRDRPGRHFGGHIHAEIPTSTDEVYAFPSYRVDISRGGTAIFTSYNGEIGYFDVEANTSRRVAGAEMQRATQYVRQTNWSHRFHYGLDQRMSRRTDVSLYGQLNPHSNKQNGQLLSDHVSIEPARRTERDRGLATYHAVTLRHGFGERNHHVVLDLSGSTYSRRNETTFGSGAVTDGTDLRPRHRQIRVRADYTRPLTSALMARTGVTRRSQFLSDGTNDGFSYDDATSEAYVALSAGGGPIELDLGLTGAHHRYGYGEVRDWRFNIHPQFSVALASTVGRQVRISGRRSVRAPHPYQINPTPWADDPFTMRRGNPDIRPSTRTDVALELSGPVGSSFLSTGVYFAHTDDAIQMLIVPNGDAVMETAHNVGDVREYGVRLSGSIRMGRFGGIQPFARLYHVEVESDASVDAGPAVRSGSGAEVGLSAYASFGPGFTVALSYQREGRGIELQRSYHSNALYFLSIGRAFSNGLKLDVATGLPFAHRYTYRSQEISAPDVVGRTNDVIKLSTVPVLVHLTYTFSRGEAQTAPQVRDVDLPMAPQRGM